MLTEKQAVHAMSPSLDFRSTVDTARYTKAVYLASTADGDSFDVHNEVTDADITFVTGGAFYPLRTKTAITLASYTVIYLY